MEFHGSHPLDNITRNNPYSILEALIPFVDYPMKLPLALLVKYFEVRLILNTFQSHNDLSKYGLHNNINDPMEILGNVMGISPDMIRTLMTLMESQSFNDINTGQNDDQQPLHNTYDYFGQNYEHFDYKDINDQDIDNNDSFDNNIKNIFAEYDLLQAAEYNETVDDINETTEPEYYI